MQDALSLGSVPSDMTTIMSHWIYTDKVNVDEQVDSVWLKVTLRYMILTIATPAL